MTAAVVRAAAGRQSAAIACELSFVVELVRDGGALRKARREATLLARGAPPDWPVLRSA